MHIQGSYLYACMCIACMYVHCMLVYVFCVYVIVCVPICVYSVFNNYVFAYMYYHICGIFGGGFIWLFGESRKYHQIKCTPFRL